MTATVSEKLSDLYNEAYAYIDQAICFDEIGHDEGAQEMYNRSLSLIENALSLPGSSDSELCRKMLKAKKYILERQAALAAKLGKTVPGSGLYPSVPDHSPFDAVSGALLAIGDVQNAEELFSIEHGVQIILIRGEQVIFPATSTFLKILKFDSNSSASAKEPPAFLQVGDWVYALLPGRSPVLSASYGAYIFPDITTAPFTVGDTEFRDAVGVILPSDISDASRKLFEDLLQQLTVLRREESLPPLSAEEKKRLSTRIAQTLTSGAVWLAQGIGKGTELANKAIVTRSSKIKANLNASEVAVQVDPRIQTGIHYLRRGSKVAVKVSGYVVDKLGQAAAVLGTRLASHVDKRISSKSGTGASVLRDAVEVSSAGISGFATVWTSLESAASILAKSLATETVQICDIKYGNNVGILADNAVHSAYNVGLAAWNVDNVGVKALAKRTAKEAGLSLLRDLEKKQKF